jgi:hypothetical protein
MSTANPTKAIAALIPEAIITPHGVAVQPLTLGTFGLLERIHSPILTGEKTDVLGMLPSLYILAHEAAEAHAQMGQIEAAALAWADALPPSAIGPIEAAAREQVQRMLAVIAQEGDAKKKVTTGGSPP